MNFNAKEVSTPRYLLEVAGKSNARNQRADTLAHTQRKRERERKEQRKKQGDKMRCYGNSVPSTVERERERASIISRRLQWLEFVLQCFLMNYKYMCYSFCSS